MSRDPRLGSLFKIGSESSSTLLPCFTVMLTLFMGEVFHLYADEYMRSSVIDIKFFLDIKFYKPLPYITAVI